jgi:hypothetical protein
MNIIGMIGGIFLAFCGLPEMIRTLKDKYCHIGWGFISIWFTGEILTFIYGMQIKQFPLLFNCGFNIIIISVMLFFKLKNIKK